MNQLCSNQTEEINGTSGSKAKCKSRINNYSETVVNSDQYRYQLKSNCWISVKYNRT